MKRIAVIGTAAILLVIMLTAGIAVAQEFPGQDQYGTTPPPADIAAFVLALVAAIFARVRRRLRRVFGRFFRRFFG